MSLLANKKMTQAEAERVIEPLRFGTPPPSWVRHFTVGRDSEIKQLTQRLKASPNGKQKKESALLLRANWGSGKSHLLQVVREVALDNGFAVSLIVADAQGGVRFNRMETIFGEVCRQIEVPGNPSKGIGLLFDSYTATATESLPSELKALRIDLSNGKRWDYSETLKSPALYVALRAWVTATGSEKADVHARIVDWLQNPVPYRSQRKILYADLVEKLRNHFRDPRPDWKFYADDVFAFNTGGHRQSWDGFADLDLIAQLSGFRGLVLLVDEFEDVIQNLTRVDYKQVAFWNLFQFFRGDRFPGQCYFAVTPEFAHKCKTELQKRRIFDYDYSQFDRLPVFQMEPIDAKQLLELAYKIRDTHSTAYRWNSRAQVPDNELQALCKSLSSNPAPDRVRQAIVGIVRVMDERLQG
jgi:hypothetical protein